MHIYNGSASAVLLSLFEESAAEGSEEKRKSAAIMSLYTKELLIAIAIVSPQLCCIYLIVVNEDCAHGSERIRLAGKISS
jgi:hypothetical protein